MIARLAPQCDGLILNANGDPARFAAFGLPVIADSVADFPGPLAGILAALDWTAANRPEVIGPERRRRLSVPAARSGRALASGARRTKRAARGRSFRRTVASGDRIVERRLRDELRHALVVEDIRKIDRWTARYKLATVTWPTEPLDPFFNANTMDDIAEAERLAALDGG